VRSTEPASGATCGIRAAALWFEFQKVDLAFVASAERRYVAECDLESPLHAVWNAFVDPSTWRLWWPDLESASYPGAVPPYGAGTLRAATVGGHKYEETILVWDERRRWGYRIDRATVPIATAQVECTEFEDRAGATRVRWTLAQDPRLLMRCVGPFFPRMMQRLLHRACANLDQVLRKGEL
jgi:hypothetical protein